MQRTVTYHGDKTVVALTDSKLLESLRELPDVERATGFIQNQDEINFTYQGDSFIEKNGLLCDEHFLSVFNLHLISGSDPGSLGEPNSILISKSFAEKYFKKNEAIGETLAVLIDGIQKPLKVSGVFEDLATNSSLSFDFLISGSTYSYWSSMIKKGALPVHSFILTRAGTPESLLDQKISKINEQTNAASTSGVMMEDQAQRLTTIQENAGLLFDFAKPVNFFQADVLKWVGWLLVLITMFTFVSMISNRILTRSTNYSILKIVGASNFSIFSQLLIETVFYIESAFILSVLVCQLILIPIVNDLTHLTLSVVSNPVVLIVFNLAFLLGTLALVFVFAFFVINISNVSIRSSGYSANYFSKSIKSGILIFQFTVSFGFVCWALASYNQLNFLKEKDLGYQKSNIVCLSYHSGIAQTDWAHLKNELSTNTLFESVGGSQYKLIGSLNASVLEKANQEALKVMWNKIDYDFLPCLNMELVSGRNFSREFPADSKAVIVNETAWKLLNDTTTQSVLFPIVDREKMVTIIGVVKDFHFESFTHEIPPVVMSLQPDFNRYLYVQTTRGIKETLMDIKRASAKAGVSEPFDIEFLDDSFRAIILDEIIIERVSLLFMLSVIVLTFVGLLLSIHDFIISNEKNFAIKKVLGASEAHLIGRLYSKFMLKILMALLIATPLCYIMISRWLEHYPYKIAFPYLSFIISFLSIVGISTFLLFVSGIKLYAIKTVDQLGEK